MDPNLEGAGESSRQGRRAVWLVGPQVSVRIPQSRLRCYAVYTGIRQFIRRGEQPRGVSRGSPRSSDGKQSTCNVGDPGSILGSGRSPGGRHGNPLQYSCLENPVDIGAWQGYSPRGHARVEYDEIDLARKECSRPVLCLWSQFVSKRRCCRKSHPPPPMLTQAESVHPKWNL